MRCDKGRSMTMTLYLFLVSSRFFFVIYHFLFIRFNYVNTNSIYVYAHTFIFYVYSIQIGLLCLHVTYIILIHMIYNWKEFDFLLVYNCEYFRKIKLLLKPINNCYHVNSFSLYGRSIEFLWIQLTQ